MIRTSRDPRCEQSISTWKCNIVADSKVIKKLKFSALHFWLWRDAIPNTRLNPDYRLSLFNLVHPIWRPNNICLFDVHRSSFWLSVNAISILFKSDLLISISFSFPKYAVCIDVERKPRHRMHKNNKQIQCGRKLLRKDSRKAAYMNE